MADDAPGPAGDESRHQQAAAQIRRQHPRRVTIWVARAGHYRAWPLFRAPRGTSFTAKEPGELTAQMNQIEQAVVQCTPGRSQDAGTVA
jgi:hypothetical protein